MIDFAFSFFVFAENRKKVVLTTDSPEFGGHNRVDHTTRFFTTPENWDGCENSLMVYLPSRTALVFALEEDL